jgi:hypothetical protein
MKLSTRQLAALMQVRRRQQTRQIKASMPSSLKHRTSVLRTYIKQVRKVT